MVVTNKVQLNPATRIIPPSTLNQVHWLAEDCSRAKRWRLPVPGIMLLVACTTPTSREDAIETVAAKAGIDSARAGEMLQVLERNQLILDVDTLKADSRLSVFQKVRAAWTTANWAEAAEYHLSTFDYPFIDYATDGRDIDIKRMHKYVEDEADDNRYKQYPDALKRFPLPAPNAGLIPSTVSDSLYKDPQSSVSLDALSRILSIAFAEIGQITSGRWPRKPMMRRTSPSGGARHPIEAYLAVLDVPGLPCGWYHIAVAPPTLELLREETTPEAELRALFPLSYGRVPMNVKCILMLTSMFERNMYRYREPRTFRTVHMDAGHLAATVQMSAGALGIKTHVAYPDTDELIERKLGLEGLKEGFMLSISFGVRSNVEQARPAEEVHV